MLDLRERGGLDLCENPDDQFAVGANRLAKAQVAANTLGIDDLVAAAHNLHYVRGQGPLFGEQVDDEDALAVSQSRTDAPYYSACCLKKSETVCDSKCESTLLSISMIVTLRSREMSGMEISMPRKLGVGLHRTQPCVASRECPRDQPPEGRAALDRHSLRSGAVRTGFPRLPLFSLTAAREEP